VANAAALQDSLVVNELVLLPFVAGLTVETQAAPCVKQQREVFHLSWNPERVGTPNALAIRNLSVGDSFCVTCVIRVSFRTDDRLAWLPIESFKAVVEGVFLPIGPILYVAGGRF
jgi:hypothetical protein